MRCKNTTWREQCRETLSIHCDFLSLCNHHSRTSRKTLPNGKGLKKEVPSRMNGSSELVEPQFLFGGFDGWIDSLAFDSGVRCGELPVDLPPLSMATGVPSGHFRSQRFQVRKALVEALPAQRSEFDLRHVEPTPLLRGVMDFEFVDEATGLFRWKGWIE